MEKHFELGYELGAPVVIPNAPDPALFFPAEAREPRSGRRIRIVATSWSDNLRKGGETLAWLDRHLDSERFELTFVGRAALRFERIRVVGPIASDGLAELLRGQDVYLAPSRDDPCSNALLEALACGLPAAYLESGGHPELVGAGGLPYREDEDLPDVLERLAADLDRYRAAIRVPSISTVADRYLDVLGLARA
jgi:glycosyltransferase involved in cell wall biosynthesis